MWTNNSGSIPGKQGSARITSLLVILLCLPLYSFARSLDDVQASGVVSIAVYRDLPPFSWEDSNGDARGIDVDIAKKIAAALKVQLLVHWMIADENLDDDLRNHVWKGHYLARHEDGPMLTHEVADVMLRVPYDREFAFKVDQDGRVINDLVHFFSPYQRERWALAVDTVKIPKIENLAMFQYEKIGVEIDTLPDFYVSGAFRGVLRNNVVHFMSTQKAMEAMNSAEVAAVMGMQSQLQWGIRQLDHSERYQLADIPFPNLITPFWDIGMAVKDDHRDLAYAVEDAVTALVNSGEMESIFRQYSADYIKPASFRTD
jgi:polar amino acid transport system substrate-binding protein